MNALPDMAATDTILLAGGGALSARTVALLGQFGSHWVAADSGADSLAAFDILPDRIIGDLDSISDPQVWRSRGVPVEHVAEQDSTDFEKCLARVDAPLILAAGFLGKRLDHTLAALTALVQREGAVILVGENDIAVHCPPRLALALEAGTRLSLYPLRPVRGLTSRGLRWRIDGLALAPDGRIGTSNAALGPVEIALDGPGMVLILPVEALSALVAALRSGIEGD
ncbi:MAG: thiamine diphosphokinase [Pseudomonadota bacterium]